MMSLILSLVTGAKRICAKAVLPLIICSGALAQTDDRTALIAEHLPARIATTDSESLFSLLSPDGTGITFQNNKIDTSHPLKRLYQSGFACGGIAIGDLEGDGLPEMFFASGPGSNQLYRQTTPFQFD
ncbi:MAG: hypothetical protein O3C21_10895, partial [Verrucomicrobia bacterium]|nr:hypothetical protein [Verrucomicrobiota bacterium]